MLLADTTGTVRDSVVVGENPLTTGAGLPPRICPTSDLGLGRSVVSVVCPSPMARLVAVSYTHLTLPTILRV